MTVVVVVLCCLVAGLIVAAARLWFSVQSLHGALAAERRWRDRLQLEVAELGVEVADVRSKLAPAPMGDGEDAVVPVIADFETPAPDERVTSSHVVSATLAEPLLKVAALSHGLRRALDDEHRMRIRHGMKRELKRQRRARRRSRRLAVPEEGWQP